LKDSGPVVLDSEALDAIDTGFRREGERSRRKEGRRELNRENQGTRETKSFSYSSSSLSETYKVILNL